MLKLPSNWAYGESRTYTDVFALTFLYNIGIVVASLLGAFIVFLIIKLCLARGNANESARESILTTDEYTRISITEEAEKLPVNPQPVPTNKSKPLIFFSFMTSFSFYCFWIAVSLIYLNFYMFGKYGRSTSLDVLSVFVLFFTVAIPALIWKHITKVTAWASMRREAVVLVLMLVLWLAASVFLVVLTKGGCVCFYNNKYGIKIDDDVEISTEFTRLNSIATPCPEGSLCHLYATVPEDASTSVFFNVHAGIKVQSLNFAIKLNDTVVAVKNASSLFKMDNVESIGQRNIYSVLFAGLTANTTYKLEISDKSGTVLKQANYKTVPGADASEIRIAAGGDLGLSENGDKMASYLVDFKPDIIVLGGDISYDDAMRSCYYSWDTVYYMFEPIYERLDRLIPMIFSVGNHDVGFDALSTLDIPRTVQDYPLFFVFNPQHLAHNQLEVPNVFQRQTLHYHKIGPTIHFMLDAGYLRSYKQQVSFIQLHSQNNSNLYRFANYHNPIYPGCTNSTPGSNDRKVIENGLKYWTPAFDDLAFVAVMEHHTHFRKITKKIKNDAANTTEGTRYIGDGSWGVTQIHCPDAKITPRPELMQNYARDNPNHMWQITLSQKNTTARQYSINYKAVNLLNETVYELQEDLPQLQ